MKVQMKRVYCERGFIHDMDKEFQSGFLEEYPKPGNKLVFYFDQPAKGYWLSTDIQRIEYDDGVTKVFTVNSEYHIKKAEPDNAKVSST